jgi:hypothetical protein
VCVATPYEDGRGWDQRRWQPDKRYGWRSPYVCISTVNLQMPGLDVDDTPETRAAWNEGRLRRTITDCVCTPLVVFDDIGSKIPAERIPLEPSYRLETSRGNLQYGYRLLPHATPADAAALIDAAIKAGLSDKGAGGANRVVRVPGSINTKPGRDSWAARIVSWNPERTFTLDTLAAGLGITPVYGGSLRALPRGAHSDLVLEELASHGMVDSTAPNADGWWHIRCIWWNEHTDGRDDAKYKPSPLGAGVFHCFHGSCRDKRRVTRDVIAHLTNLDPSFKERLRVPLPFSIITGKE